MTASQQGDSMKVAEIHITSSGRGLMSGFVHTIGFSDIGVATAEFERIVDLLKRRSDRSNELPKLVELNGIDRLSVPLDDISSVGLSDIAKSNAEMSGVKEAYPNLTWK